MTARTNWRRAIFTTRVTPTSEDELGKLAQDFNQLASTLEKNQQMRRDFMADISHELRTPLAVLRGELEAIQDGVRKFTPETVASLQAEVGTLTKLVDDLHQLSMSDEGARLSKSTGRFDPTAGSGGRRISRTICQSWPETAIFLPDSITVFGDRDRLMQLFNNFTGNSLRYTDSGGGLKISAGQHDKTVRLTFADSAPVSVTISYKNCLNVLSHRRFPQPCQRRFRAGAGDLPEHC